MPPATYFTPGALLLASKAAALGLCLWPPPSRNSPGSVLPRLGPLRAAIHSRRPRVASPEPSWILSLGFIGWQLIYPLHTFQMTGPRTAGKKGRRKTCFESTCTLRRVAGVFRQDPRNPGVPQEAGCTFLCSWLRFGSSEMPALTRCYGNEGRSAGTLQHASSV